MRTLILLTATATLAFGAKAQTVTDGSDHAMSVVDRRIVVDAVAKKVLDPSSVEIRRLRPGDGPATYWCGEINVLEDTGVFTGFRPFFVILGSGWIVSSSYAQDGTESHTMDNLVTKRCKG